MNQWQQADFSGLQDIDEYDVKAWSGEFEFAVTDLTESWLDWDDANQEEHSDLWNVDEQVVVGNNRNIADHRLLAPEEELRLATALQGAFRHLQCEFASSETGRESLFDYLSAEFQVIQQSAQENTDNFLLETADEILTLLDRISLFQYLAANRVVSTTRQEQIGKESLGAFAQLSETLKALELDRIALLELAEKLAGNKRLPASAQTGFRRCLQRIQKLRNRLTTANVRLVYHIASRHRDKGLEFDDMVQEGIVGLLRAATKYDVTVGVRFSTYAYWWIRQAVRLAIINQRSQIRYPNHVATQVNKLYATYQNLRQQGKDKVTISELSRITGFNQAKIKDLQTLTNLCLSANTPLYADGDTTLVDVLPSNDASAAPHSSLENLERVALVREWLNVLPPRAAKIIAMKYGIGHRSCYSLNEIAPQIGVSRERVRQIIEESMAEIRQRSARDQCLLAAALFAADFP